PSSLRRADAVALTHVDLASAEEVGALRAQIAEAHGAPPIAELRHAWSGVQVHEPDRHRMTLEGSEWLDGRRVAICCAIGEPEQFLSMVRRAGSTILGSLILRDHASFDARAVAELAGPLDFDRGDAILCTAKDWPR